MLSVQFAAPGFSPAPGTLIAYITTARQIKKHPIGQRKLKSITADHLQEYIDFLSFAGTKPDGTQALPISKNYMLQFSAVLPIQISYYTGLRIGEVYGLAWQDINLEEQYLTIRRSMRYNATRHKMEIGATKRKKIRTVDFCDTLAEILKKARKQQHRERFQCGEMYFRNYYQKRWKKEEYIDKLNVIKTVAVILSVDRNKAKKKSRQIPNRNYCRVFLPTYFGILLVPVCQKRAWSRELYRRL